METNKKLIEISKFFDDPEKALHILKSALTKGKKIQSKDGDEYSIDEFYDMHKSAYFRRIKNKIRHSIKILEIEVEWNELQIGSEYCSNKRPGLDDYDKKRDERNYSAYYGDWSNWDDV